MAGPDQPVAQGQAGKAGKAGGPPAGAPARPRRLLATLAGVVATLAAAAFVVALATRLIDCPDVGYHLAYGEHFLDTGQIVQTNRFIYAPMDKELLSEPKNLGPGCRFDAASGAYHFVNANWLSQVVMAGVHRAGGMLGLSLLQAAMWAGIAALVVLTLRRNGVAWHWAGLPLILIGFATFIRMPLRPEVFGYLLLAGQWCLLAASSFAWPAAVGVAVLQVLAVNCHSYFLLGIALTGVMLLDALLPWCWGRLRPLLRSDPAEASKNAAPALAFPARAKWLAIALAAVLAGSFVNPWHYRGATMPLETVKFLRENHVIGDRNVPKGQLHPWAIIAEFRETLPKDPLATRDTSAFIAVLVLTGLAGLVALRRLQWGWVLAMAGMVMVGFQMRRNIAPATLILAPLGIIVLSQGWRGIRVHMKPAMADRAESLGGLAVALAIAATGAWCAASVLTNRFYLSSEGTGRFGLGSNKFMLPLEPAEWINTHNPPGHVFTEYGTTSDLMYFTHPHRDMPMLSNTWAYPPYIKMRQSLIAAGLAPLEPLAKENDIHTVVLSSSSNLLPLTAKLAADPDWAIVQLCPRYQIFLHRGGPTREMAGRLEKTALTFDVEEFMQRCLAADTVPVYALNRGGMALTQLGWLGPAMKVWQRSLQLQPENVEGLFGEAACHVAAGELHTKAMKAAQDRSDQAGAARARQDALEQWEQAKAILEQVLQRDRRHERSVVLLRKLEAAINSLSGVPAMRR